MSFSFTGLLSTNMDDNWGASELKNDKLGSEAPKFKSVQPASLSISSSPLSPSSYLAALSPTQFLLNSPLFLSSPNILSTSTTEAFADQSFNWRNSESQEEEKNHSNFSFPTQAKPESLFQFSSSMFQAEEPLINQEAWKLNEPSNQNDFSSQNMAINAENPSSTQSFCSEMAVTKSNVQSDSAPVSGYLNHTNSTQSIREQRRSEDGYNWRKYGQKQVKGSENPRSYYKCTHPSCTMKKKVETSLEGHITEIVYKGSHNHPKPQSKRRTSSQLTQPSMSCTNSGISDQSVVTLGNPQMEQDSSSSFGEENLEQTSHTSYSGEDDDEFGTEAKRWKGDNENDGYSAAGSRTVREPRVVVQTTSEIDILDDGFRWRKYGQKVVKGNPNPRSYYKCTYSGCSVRKQVERAAHDMKAVITTYEGKHNHNVPAARGSAGCNANRIPLNINTSNAPTPIRPSVVSNYSNSSLSFTNSLYSTRLLPTSTNQDPFPLDMLQSPGSFGFTGFGRSNGSYGNNAQNSNDERKDDTFLQSFLSKN